MTKIIALSLLLFSTEFYQSGQRRSKIRVHVLCSLILIHTGRKATIVEIGALRVDSYLQELCIVLGQFLTRFSSLAGSMLNCGSVLNWLEVIILLILSLTTDFRLFQTERVCRQHIQN